MTINLSYLGEIMVYTIAGEPFKAIAPSKEIFDCLIDCLQEQEKLARKINSKLCWACQF